MLVLRLGTSIFLSVLFLVVYGGCNWYTASRPGVGSFFFEWERAIPFLPWMILPYMSIDLFFVTAPFVCRSREQVLTFGRRVTFSILVAGLFFLVWPLKFAFTRPHADGIMGLVFDWFRTLDQPFNQFPSLHITLGVILLDTWARRIGGLGRVLLFGWFVLIMSSTVTTFQHHVIDVIGGAGLAVVTFVLFPRKQEAQDDATNAPDRVLGTELKGADAQAVRPAAR